jgi:hypothetical protein
MIKKPKPDTRQIVGGKTVFQEFADFLAQDKGDRDAVYEVAVSESSMVIFRRKDIKPTSDTTHGTD